MSRQYKCKRDHIGVGLSFHADDDSPCKARLKKRQKGYTALPQGGVNNPKPKPKRPSKKDKDAA